MHVKGPQEVGQYIVLMETIQFSEDKFDGGYTGLKVEIEFGRQVINVLLVTYLPTLLMNIINQATNYFAGDEFFGDVIAVNVTSMMVLSAIYISFAGSLPITSSVNTTGKNRNRVEKNYP